MRDRLASLARQFGHMRYSLRPYKQGIRRFRRLRQRVSHRVTTSWKGEGISNSPFWKRASCHESTALLYINAARVGRSVQGAQWRLAHQNAGFSREVIWMGGWFQSASSQSQSNAKNSDDPHPYRHDHFDVS